VWQQVMTSLGHLRSVFAANEEIATGLKNYVRKLVTPATENIGWEFKQGDDFLTGQLRQLLISSAGSSGHEGYVVASTSHLTRKISDLDLIQGHCGGQEAI
jgi:Ras-related protein Rab-1A